jgi:2-polyprenyl-6-methoxyphenol hydroxylase-like FAD-dependent oxidoreductase
VTTTEDETRSEPRLDETEHPVAIVGAGPTGTMLAAELALAGVDAVLLERRAGAGIESARGRAGGLHARTIEVLDQRGVAERFLAEGEVMQVAAFAGVTLDLGGFPTRHPYGLALWQKHTERILGAWAGELGVVARRGREVTGLTQDDAGVDLRLADGATLRAGYVVGCDGGRSLVRRLAGIDFPGWGPSVASIVAEVELEGDPEFGVRNDALGINAMRPLEGGRVGLVVRDESLEREGDLTLEDVRAAVFAVWGSDFGLRSADMISRFTDATRQAASYRAGRVVLAGDAAHIHYPAGGQGLNLGVQDAVNLGWKLAQVVAGAAPAGLLDTYHAERHPAAARVLRYTMALTALQRGDDRTGALIEVVGDLLEVAAARDRVAGLASGLDVHYDLGEGHPLLGRRMPDLDLVTDEGPRRVHALLHAARPVLLVLGEPRRLDIASWADRVQTVDATYDGAWELPVLGDVPAPTAVLVRPDGYVAWVGEGSDSGLANACATWLGPPAAA